MIPNFDRNPTSAETSFLEESQGERQNTEGHWELGAPISITNEGYAFKDRDMILPDVQSSSISALAK